MKVLLPWQVCFSHIVPPKCCLSLTVLDHQIGIRLKALEKLPRLGALDGTLTDWFRTIHTNLLNSDLLVVTFRTHARCFQANSLGWQAYCCFLWLIPLCQVGSAIGNHSGSLLVRRARRPTWRKWVYSGDDSSDEQGFAKFLALVQGIGNKGYIYNENYVKMHPQHLDQRGRPILFPGNLLGSRVLHLSGKEPRHHCLHRDPVATSPTQSSSVLLPNA